MSTPITAVAIRVATDLRHIGVEVENSGDGPRDAITGDAVYRLLDAPYYAWLRRRMERAKTAHEAGKLPAATWQTLRDRFNAIHQWAITHLGEAALVAALTNLDEKSYVPPCHKRAVAPVAPRELTLDDVESFKALGVEAHLKSSAGEFTLVPEYTGKDRPEISVDDLRKLSMVMHAFPGSEIVHVGPPGCSSAKVYAPPVTAPKPPTMPPAPKPQPKSKQPNRPPEQAPLF